MKETLQWYEREHWPYAEDRARAKQYADWFRQVPWRFFCTFTFAGKVSDAEADAIFKEFINRLERSHKSNVGYVRGDEKRPSGCGKPASGRHFHVVMACAAHISPGAIRAAWTPLAGNANHDAGALVEPYDASQNGVSYCLKFINHPDGDWASRNLHLFHPEAKSYKKRTNAREGS
jgi:hypothetical protein